MATATVAANPLREGLREQRMPEPCAMVIFGASGDLTQRKLVPALYSLALRPPAAARFAVVGVARRPMADDEFRAGDARGRRASSRARRPVDGRSGSASPSGIFYVAGDFDDPAPTSGRDDCLDELDRERGTSGNRLFYLATPPADVSRSIVKRLGAARAHRPRGRGRSRASSSRSRSAATSRARAR